MKAITGIEFPAHDLPAACAFYCDLLGFTRGSEDAAVVELGGTFVRFRRTGGRAIPPEARNNDRTFRHLAIAVRDIERGYRKLSSAGVEFVSEPVALPDRNPATAGIVAAYLHDLEGHPVELIEFPPGKGHHDVHDHRRRDFLGVDHTAIVVANTSRAEAFYCDRHAFTVESRSHNTGPEQERLSGVRGADVLVTGLRGAGGIGLELLEYLAPKDGRDMPPDTSADDLWASVSCLGEPEAEPDWNAPLTRDPDGHYIRG